MERQQGHAMTHPEDRMSRSTTPTTPATRDGHLRRGGAAPGAPTVHPRRPRHNQQTPNHTLPQQHSPTTRSLAPHHNPRTALHETRCTTTAFTTELARELASVNHFRGVCCAAEPGITAGQRPNPEFATARHETADHGRQAHNRRSEACFRQRAYPSKSGNVARGGSGRPTFLPPKPVGTQAISRTSQRRMLVCTNGFRASWGVPLVWDSMRRNVAVFNGFREGLFRSNL